MYAKHRDPMKGKKQRTTFYTSAPNFYAGVTWKAYRNETKVHLKLTTKPVDGQFYRADKVDLWGPFLDGLEVCFLLVLF